MSHGWGSAPRWKYRRPSSLICGFFLLFQPQLPNSGSMADWRDVRPSLWGYSEIYSRPAWVVNTTAQRQENDDQKALKTTATFPHKVTQGMVHTPHPGPLPVGTRLACCRRPAGK